MPKRAPTRPPALRTERIELRVTAAELAAFRASAEADGLTISGWARRALRIASGLLVVDRGA